MKSFRSSQARNFFRIATKCKHGIPHEAVRWSSAEARQWSTPLAKQLSEAITVCKFRIRPLHLHQLMPLVGHGTGSFGDFYANVLDIGSRRILYIEARRT